MLLLLLLLLYNLVYLLACYFSHYSHATRNFSSQVLAELRTKEKERVERHKLLDSRRKWREEEERKQLEKERRDNDRAHALDRARNVRPTDISDSRQLGSPFKGERKRTSKRDLEARRNNPKPYSALDAGGDNDQPWKRRRRSRKRRKKRKEEDKEEGLAAPEVEADGVAGAITINHHHYCCLCSTRNPWANPAVFHE